LIPAAFDYQRAGSIEEAITMLTQAGDDAKLLAGGHSLLPLMKLRLAQPAILIDITHIPDTNTITETPTHLTIGALTRHHDIEHSPLLHQHAPLLAHAAKHVGDPQVRHRGTIGGSIAHGDPASDLPATILALGATLTTHSPRGTRTINATDFFTGFLETTLAPDEILTTITIPKTNGAGWSFQKFNRRAQDWAIVGVAAHHSPTHTAIALINMGQTPILATTAANAITNGATAHEAAQLATTEANPTTDLNATTTYRTHLAKVLVERALLEAGAH
jgi:carbon-monoxide dehydrogenase medium subunit